jgi:hypothetical protein
MDLWYHNQFEDKNVSDINDLKRRAGITEAEDVKELWKQYTRLSQQLARALTKTAIDTHGEGRAPEGHLNPLQVGDIEYHMEMVAEQLERLDKVYRWREYMDKRRAGQQVQAGY